MMQNAQCIGDVQEDVGDILENIGNIVGNVRDAPHDIRDVPHEGHHNVLLKRKGCTREHQYSL